MADSNGFSSFVPGFDFLQSLVKNAGATLPSMGQWVVPTLDPAELERRIEELRTVQFWLDQNSRMLATTIQALEVQRMTLSALKGMNVSVNELQHAMQMRPSPAPAANVAPAAPKAPDATAAPESTTAAASPAAGSAASAAPAAPAGVVDAMQWWSALTEQFTQIANQAMQGGAQPPAAAASAERAAAGPAGRPAPAGKPAATKVAAKAGTRRRPAKPQP